MEMEMLNLAGPLGGGGVAGVIAFTAIKIFEIKAGLPAIQAELDSIRRAHLACEERITKSDEACALKIKSLEARIDELLNRLTEQG